jgi:hypothetical protein
MDGDEMLKALRFHHHHRYHDLEEECDHDFRAAAFVVFVLVVAIVLAAFIYFRYGGF